MLEAGERGELVRKSVRMRKVETDLFNETDIPVIDEDDGNQRQDHEDNSHV